MDNITLTPIQEKKFLNLLFSESLNADPEARKEGEILFLQSVEELEKSQDMTAQVKSFELFCERFATIPQEYFDHVSIVSFFENTLLEMQNDVSEPLKAMAASQQYMYFQELKKKFIESEKLNNIQDF